MRIAECLEFAKTLLSKISSGEISEDDIQKLEDVLTITEERLNYYAEEAPQLEGLEDLYDKVTALCEVLLDVLEGIYLHCQPVDSSEQSIAEDYVEDEEPITPPSLQSLEEKLNEAFIIYHEIEEQIKLNKEMLEDIPLTQA